MNRLQLVTRLERHEGVRLKPYRDTVGKLTIGIGRNLDDVGISKDEAYYLVNGDIDFTVRGLLGRYPWFATLDPVRQAALVNMGFNLGLDGLAGFKKMLAALAAGDYAKASEEITASQ